MSALSFPEGAAEEIEQRFAQRAKGVDKAEGFEGFELLRPRLWRRSLLRDHPLG
ncbi:antibiotic biosynthesis monooxygenase family protein [Corynebacterium pseudodiphtheriticum]|uniref:antibiotic biosynthesis monooxygenase family protein n=1 Tax=Corynebacterium pseudodiphtheriticum TaxID=37637 RepID=UPI003D72AC76